MAKPTPEQIAELDRHTTDMGLYNFAESYLLCAKSLTSQKIDGLRFADPIEYLYYHAIELFLKSYLRNREIGAYELSDKYGHKLVKISSKAKALGLALDQEDIARLQHLHDQELVIDSRYIFTGGRVPGGGVAEGWSSAIAG